MKSLRIAHTVYLLLGVSFLAGGSASSYLMIRCGMVSTRYTAIVQGEIAQAQKVRVLQVTFKKQVQAWKDILLRGSDEAALKKYDAEFHTLAEQVDARSIELASEIKDPQAREGLDSFTRQHKMLDDSYESALAGFKLSLNFAEADAAVKGKDRPPTDSLDHVAEQLTDLAARVPAEEAASLHREQVALAWGLALLWLAIGMGGVVFARSLGVRMDRCVQFVRVIAGGDLTAIAPEQSGEDELGMLIEAVRQMRDQLRQMIGSIQSVAGSLSSNGDAVSDSSSRIARAVSELREESSQVAAALEEMIASVGEITRHCAEAAQQSARTGDLAAQSGNSLKAVAGEVRELAVEAQRNAKNVQELGERSSQIGRIVTLIQEIAGQTNLLALNAAIEAARAGEHGRGFAVVAGEVRQLAERTTKATKEIAAAVKRIQEGTQEAVDSIKGSSERVEKSVATAEAASQSLGVVSSSAAEVRVRIEQIAQATAEQSQASALVGKSMNGIARSITASSDGAGGTAQTALQLAQLSRQLEEQCGQFKTAVEIGRPQLVVRSRVA
jgi:methyl-accepting chemotaxis protein